MPRQNITTGTPWEASAGYARAVRLGNVIHVAGTTAATADGQVVAVGDAYQQTVFIIQKIQKALQELDADLADVVRTRMYVTNIADWQAVTRAHGAFFQTIRPVTTLIAVVSLIDPQMLVEIEAEALLER